MTRKTTGRDGWRRATLKTSKNTSNPAGLVALALWGLPPVAVTDWIIHREGLCDA